MIRKDGPDEGRYRENEEIDFARRAALNPIWIDLLDDAVRNHRRARCDAEYEHCELRWNWERRESDLGTSQNPDRRAPYDHRFSPSDTVREPAEEWTSYNPPKGNHRSGDDGLVVGQLQILLKRSNSPNHVADRGGCK